MSTPKKRSKYPVSSFGPELMTLLLKGSRETVVLTFDQPDDAGRKRAKTLQLRIQTLRQRMREEEHEDYPLTTRAKVSVMWGRRAVEFGGPDAWMEDDIGKRGALLVIRPHDAEFGDELAKAGVILAPLRPASAPVDSDEAPEGDLLGEILGLEK